MKPQSQHGAFCWEQVNASNPLFRVTQLYSDEAAALRLLPLYALFGMLEKSTAGSADEAVARQKLGWWCGELLQRPPEESSHPVVREFVGLGAAEVLRGDACGRVLSACIERIDRPAIGSLDDLAERCRKMGRARLALESELVAPEADYSGDDRLAQRAGLAQLLRENACWAGEDAAWWLPLDLLARHGLSRADYLLPENVPASRALLSEIVTGVAGSSMPIGQVKTDISNKKQSDTHVLLIDRLYEKKFVRLLKRAPVEHGEEWRKLRLSEVTACWWAARKINRRK